MSATEKEEKKRKMFEEFLEPNVSDTTLLLKVEDLIKMATGLPETNTVNFKILQTVMYVLARQMRILNQQVELRIHGEEAAAEMGLGEENMAAEGEREKDKAEKTAEKAARKEQKEKDREQKKKDKEKKDKQDEVQDSSSAEDGQAERQKKSKKESEKGERDGEEREKYKEGERGRGGNTQDKAKEGGSAGDKGKDKGKTWRNKDGGIIEETTDSKGKPGKKEKGHPGKSTTAISGGSEKDQKSARGAPSGAKITEREGPGHEKIIVVQTTPATSDKVSEKSVTRVGSIEVVTKQQFAALEKAVELLKEKSGPLPMPVMPDNKKLRADIAKGQATLTDTMQAMKLSSRVEAAEKAIGRMTELLTQLASTGALPEEYASKAVDIRVDFDNIKSELDKTKAERDAKESEPDKTMMDREAKADKADTMSIASKKSVLIDPETKKPFPPGTAGRWHETAAAGRPAQAAGSRASGRFSISSVGGPGVTHLEMENAFYDLRHVLENTLTGLTSRTSATADAAIALVKAVTDRMDQVSKLNDRISHLNSLLMDYSDQLDGFDDGLKLQMKGFAEQMNEMRKELHCGIKQLENVNNNAETAAVLELKERFEAIVLELDILLHAHGKLTSYQRDLRDELKSLNDCVEMMKEQKADRDEVMDGLRDKADQSRLVGLLTEPDFADARIDLEQRLEMCYDRFKKQDAVWMNAIHEFHEIISSKADLMLLLGMREDAQTQLTDVHDSVHKLELLLGDPKAALLARQLAKDATCGICRVPALMDVEAASKGAPPMLPAAWPLPQFPLDDPHVDKALECAKKWLPKPVPTKDKVHMCHRYVGGSHTLLKRAKTERSGVPASGPPMRKFIERGINGQVYHFEEPYKPCMECNESERIPGEADVPTLPLDGAGDREGSRRITIVDTSCAPKTVLTEEQMARVSVPDLPQHRPTRLDVVASTSSSQPLAGSLGNIVRGRTRSTLLNEDAMRHAALHFEMSAKRASAVVRIEGEGSEAVPAIQAEEALPDETSTEPEIIEDSPQTEPKEDIQVTNEEVPVTIKDVETPNVDAANGQFGTNNRT